MFLELIVIFPCFDISRSFHHRKCNSTCKLCSFVRCLMFSDELVRNLGSFFAKPLYCTALYVFVLKRNFLCTSMWLASKMRGNCPFTLKVTKVEILGSIQFYFSNLRQIGSINYCLHGKNWRLQGIFCFTSTETAREYRSLILTGMHPRQFSHKTVEPTHNIRLI